MPLAKSFNIVLENSSAENEYVVLNGTDSTGVADSGDRVIGLDASQSEAKPSWLTEAADGSGDYAKENVIAFDGGWGFQPGSKSSGNDNANADPEIIAAIRGLRKSIDVWIKKLIQSFQFFLVVWLMLEKIQYLLLKKL